MPQYPFLQVMYVAAIAAVLGVALAIPVGARRGAPTGRRVLRGTLIALAIVLAACLFWGSSSGDLAEFNVQLGIDAWIQMLAFFGIVLFTGAHFVGRFLDDRAAREREAAQDDSVGSEQGGSGQGESAAIDAQGEPAATDVQGEGSDA